MGFLLGLLNQLGAITKSLASAYQAHAVAQTDQERIHAEQQIKTLEARRDVMVAEARSPGNVIMRGLLAIPVVAILWKIFIYDKFIGGTTLMSPDLWHVVWVVLGFYFLDNIANRFVPKR